MRRGGSRQKQILADNVRVLRAKNRWSQTELAEQAGLTQGSISAIELAQANPRFETIERIAQALDVSIAALFTSERRK
jgi:transcriptional regulator with XRE-family HTH domain